MTPEQVKLIKLTFVEVMNAKQQVGRMFYDRLFAIAPDTRAMFKTDIDAQAAKLMDTLALAVGMLRDVPNLVSTLQALGERHAGYGVKDEHYAKVGEALLWTLEQGLGQAFTPQVREAWAALYGTAAKVMMDASRPPRAASVA